MKDISKFYIGRMGSGKSYAACYDTNEGLKQGAAVIVYDPIKGATDFHKYCKSEHTLILDWNISEGAFLDKVEHWMHTNSEKSENLKKINRLLADTEIPTVFVIEEFHIIKDKKRVADLVSKSREYNCVFKLITQHIDQNDLIHFPKPEIDRYVFALNSPVESTILLGSEVASKIHTSQKGYCYVNSSEETKQFPLVDIVSKIKTDYEIVKKLKNF